MGSKGSGVTRVYDPHGAPVACASARGRGGIGRRARFRSWCRKTCRFKSCRPHCWSPNARLGAAAKPLLSRSKLAGQEPVEVRVGELEARVEQAPGHDALTRKQELGHQIAPKRKP